MAHAGRGLAQTQSPGRLTVGELLEVAEQDDFTVNILKMVEGHLEMALQLSPQCLGRGSESRIAKTSREIERGSVG